MHTPPPPPAGLEGAAALALTASPTPTTPSNAKIFGAEAVGTAVLMMIGPGSAILAGDVIGTYGVAFAFGLALLAMAYTIGHVSGCHINPAVTLAFLFSRKLSFARAGWYWLAQVVGAFVGGLVIFIVSDAGDLDQTGNFAANGWGADIGSDFGFLAMVVVEIVFTALLVLVVLSTTTVGYPSGFGGLAAGLTLAMIHLATIPVDNTSVNPARSFGSAIFSGWEAVGQLWAFVVFPLAGALLGVLVWRLVHDEQIERRIATGGP
ncbi:MAG: aquaporin [Ilumatobacteraceae bacterium]